MSSSHTHHHPHHQGNLKVQISGVMWALLLRHLSRMQSNEDRQLLRGVYTARTSLSDVDHLTVEERHLTLTGVESREEKAGEEEEEMKASQLPATYHSHPTAAAAAAAVVGEVHFRRVSGGAPAGLTTLSAAEKRFIKTGSASAAAVRQHPSQQQQQQQQKVLLLLIENDCRNDPSTRYIDYGLYMTSSQPKQQQAASSSSLSSSSSSYPPRLVPLHIINLGNTVLDFVDVAEMCSYSTAASSSSSSSSSLAAKNKNDDDDASVYKRQSSSEMLLLPSGNGPSRVQLNFKATVAQIEEFAAQFDDRARRASEQQKAIADLLAERDALRAELSRQQQQQQQQPMLPPSISGADGNSGAAAFAPSTPSSTTPIVSAIVAAQHIIAFEPSSLPPAQQQQGQHVHAEIIATGTVVVPTGEVAGSALHFVPIGGVVSTTTSAAEPSSAVDSLFAPSKERKEDSVDSIADALFASTAAAAASSSADSVPAQDKQQLGRHSDPAAAGETGEQ